MKTVLTTIQTKKETLERSRVNRAFALFCFPLLTQARPAKAPETMKSPIYHDAKVRNLLGTGVTE